MIKNIRFFVTFLLAAVAYGAMAQSTATTSSPYSRYGLGDLTNQGTPQSIGMGNIGTATNRIGGYSTVNSLNPASYATIDYTTIDVGLYANFVTLNNGTLSQSNSNFRFSHVAFGIPVTKHSALAFGLTPYSEMGYNYKSTKRGFGTGALSDTGNVSTIYQGDGGLSKAFLGYGFSIGRHLFIGGNVSYIFGSLEQNQSTEIPNLYSTLDSRINQSNHVGGINYDYGVQYSIDFSETKHLVLGYSASAGTKIGTQSSYIVEQYVRDANGNENIPIDTVTNLQSPKGKIKLPQTNHFGISFRKDGSFLIGADYTMSNWSTLTIAGVNAGLQDSKTFNIGGQITPNSNSLSNYLALIDYRLGAIYDESYLKVNNTSIKRYAATFGFGMPLPHDRASNAFYKVNLAAEIGRRGTLTNGLVKENYVNIHIGFTLNDKWFTRYRFE